MGQRLVIQINYNDIPMANAYYHWSAYTGSAIELVNEVIESIEEFDETEHKFTDRQKAVWFLYQTGARFSPDEITQMETERFDQKNYTFAMDNKEVDRNNGLICITNDGMKNSVSWEEGHVSIDIYTGEILFDVYYQDEIEYFENWNDIKIEDLPVFTEPERLNYNDESWEFFNDQIMNILNKNEYNAISPDRRIIYSFIA